jgi:hypothetical protein
MPRPARRPKSRRAGYTVEHIRHLLHGFTFMTGSGFGFNRRWPERSDFDAMRKAWDELRHELLPEWAREHPGTRPYAFWKFDSVQFEDGRRRRIDGKPHPFDCKQRSLHVAKSDRPDFWKVAYALRRGLPSTYIMPFDRDLQEDFMQNIMHGRDSVIFEPEWSYLQRHGLLLPEDSP